MNQRSHPPFYSNALLKQLHWLPLEWRIQFKLATLTFKVLVASVVTNALVLETDRGQDGGTGFEAKAEAVASETEAVDPETEAKAARQLIGICYSILINIKSSSFHHLFAHGSTAISTTIQ